MPVEHSKWNSHAHAEVEKQEQPLRLAAAKINPLQPEDFFDSPQ